MGLISKVYYKLDCMMADDEILIQSVFSPVLSLLASSQTTSAGQCSVVGLCKIIKRGRKRREGGEGSRCDMNRIE